MKFYALLCLILISTSAAKAQTELVIGCYNAVGVNAYPVAQLNEVVRLYIGGKITISEAVLTNDVHGNYLITATKSEKGNQSKIAINLKVSGNFIMLYEGSCIHKCASTKREPCEMRIDELCRIMSCQSLNRKVGCNIMISVGNKLSPALIQYLNQLGSPPGC